MSRRITVFVLAAALVMANAVLARNTASMKAPSKIAVMGGGNEPYDAIQGPIEHRAVRDHSRTLDEVYQAGTTWYDYQHNGTNGKMIGIDDLGWVQVSWMNGLTEVVPGGPRHVFWNAWDPSTGAFLDATGRQANSSNRAGYITSYTNHEGWCFPAFHEIIPGDPGAHSAAGIDYLPNSGAFTITQPAWFEDPDGAQTGLMQSIWPKIAVTWNPDTVVHMVSTESPLSGLPGDPQDLHYSRGIPVFDEFGSGVEIEWQPVDGDLEFLKFDLVMTIAADIAASRSGDRVAMAWAHPIDDPEGPLSSQTNNDCYLMISEDGGLTWGEQMNITAFPTPDFECPSGDTVACNLDTFRLYTDCTVFFDEEDFVHVAFTTIAHWEVGATDWETGEILPGPWTFTDMSGVWHWGEEYQEFTPIMNEYHMGTIDGVVLNSRIGAWQFNAQRPNLAIDPVTNYLYCSIMRYDSNQYSANGQHYMADAWVSVSGNGGRVWSVPTNVTNTDGGADAPEGESMSERDITLAERVTYVDGVGYLHMEYVFDTEAGAAIQTPPEGNPTLCPVMYQRIPISEIPLCPIQNPYWPAFHVDSTGFPGSVVLLDTSVICDADTDAVGDIPSLRPESFTLYQNYPNPFNPSTKILFDLNRDAIVSLKVYNVVGQEVATMFDNKLMHAGAQTADFDASSLSSGVYMYKLSVGDQNITRKMVLMK